MKKLRNFTLDSLVGINLNVRIYTASHAAELKKTANLADIIPRHIFPRKIDSDLFYLLWK